MSAVPMLLGPTTAATLLAADRDSRAWVGPGLLGFVVIAALGIATYLLWRNMNKQIRKVDFETGPETDSASESESESGSDNESSTAKSD